MTQFFDTCLTDTTFEEPNATPCRGRDFELEGITDEPSTGRFKGVTDELLLMHHMACTLRTAVIELPDLVAAMRADGVGQLTWPLRFVLWGLAAVAEERQIELDELRIHMELQGRPTPLIFPIHEAAEQGVAQTLHGRMGAELTGGAHSCRLRVVAHLVAAAGGGPSYQERLPLESPSFLLHVPHSDDSASHASPSAHASEGMHWLDQAAAGTHQDSKLDGPPDLPWWFSSYAHLHDSIRRGKQDARYLVWTCRSLSDMPARHKQPSHVEGDGHHYTPPDAPWRKEDVHNDPDDVGPRPSRSAKSGEYVGCTGYGNRLYGVATALVYALLTDRALLIQWPGHEHEALQHFMAPGRAAFDWRADSMAQQLEELTWASLDDRVSRAHVRSTLLSHNLTAMHQDVQLVYLTCNEAFFVDILHNPYHRARLERLGLSSGEAVFGLLRHILEPSSLVLQASQDVLQATSIHTHEMLMATHEGLDAKNVDTNHQESSRRCGVLAVQIRMGTASTGAYAVLDASEVPLFWDAARAIEATMLSASNPPPCVRWLIASDDADVVDSAIAVAGHHRVLWYQGPVAHIDSRDATQLQLLKVFNHTHTTIHILAHIVVCTYEKFSKVDKHSLAHRQALAATHTHATRHMPCSSTPLLNHTHDEGEREGVCEGGRER